MITSAPLFKHDCEGCKFVASIITQSGPADLYISCSSFEPSFILRYSDEESDYSCLPMANLGHYL